ncbi:hypothetical protein JCGZ_24153 [Jatropha curcas]|uniref:Uncharacterized protein n=1 Tax=Jatropha curcas TaxID=180498 RepID=A0A067JSI0_JATCU|nr:hypothetical protein JCGZ_24152 [Jatropha curcas]KDP25744.1 hypothetical protein JCGZ_24153 [Jatropha curcas]
MGVLSTERACPGLPEASMGGLESDTSMHVLFRFGRVSRPGLPEASTSVPWTSEIGTGVLKMARLCSFFLGLQRSKSSIY